RRDRAGSRDRWRHSSIGSSEWPTSPIERYPLGSRGSHRRDNREKHRSQPRGLLVRQRTMLATLVDGWDEMTSFSREGASTQCAQNQFRGTERGRPNRCTIPISQPENALNRAPAYVST